MDTEEDPHHRPLIGDHDEDGDYGEDDGESGGGGGGDDSEDAEDYCRECPKPSPSYR